MRLGIGHALERIALNPRYLRKLASEAENFGRSDPNLYRPNNQLWPVPAFHGAPFVQPANPGTKLWIEFIKIGGRGHGWLSLCLGRLDNHLGNSEW
jgi:hypothetical protein